MIKPGTSKSPLTFFFHISYLIGQQILSPLTFQVYQEFFLFINLHCHHSGPSHHHLSGRLLQQPTCFTLASLWSSFSSTDMVIELKSDHITPLHMMAACFIQSESYKALPDLLPLPISLPFTHPPHSLCSSPTGLLLLLKRRRYTLGPLYLLFPPSEILFSQNPELTPSLP